MKKKSFTERALHLDRSSGIIEENSELLDALTEMTDNVDDRILVSSLNKDTCQNESNVHTYHVPMHLEGHLIAESSAMQRWVIQ